MMMGCAPGRNRRGPAYAFLAGLVLLAVPLLPRAAGAGASAASRIGLTPDEAARVERGGIAVREVEDTSVRGKTFEAIAAIEASRETVYRTLTDFGAYHEFMPNISSCRVLSRGEGEAVADFVLGLPLGRTKKYRLKLRFHEEESAARISWTMLDWPGLDPEESIADTSGFWRLEGYPGRPDRTLALYHVFTDPGEVPTGTGWIVDLLSEKSLPRTIRQTRARAIQMAEENRR